MRWTALLFGWPSALVSILLGIWGLLARRWRVLLAGALAALPFLFYLFLTRIGLLAVAVALCYAAAVAAASKGRMGLAWPLFAPMLLLAGYVAMLAAGSRLGPRF